MSYQAKRRPLAPWMLSLAICLALAACSDKKEEQAAAQEIEKLKLMAEDGQITVETVQGAVADSARFDVFGLVDAILNGEPAHALRMLEGLIDLVGVRDGVALELVAEGQSLRFVFRGAR